MPHTIVGVPAVGVHAHRGVDLGVILRVDGDSIDTPSVPSLRSVELNRRDTKGYN